MSKPVPLFEAIGIEKEFPLPNDQSLHVLEKINLELHPGEVVAIIGPSGCGKSTLLRILAGLIPSTAGKRLCRGKEVSALVPDMSIVFQSFALYPWMTVKQNIQIVLKAAGASVETMEQKSKEAIALVGLTGFEEAYPREISGGMKQRVGIARALVRSPEMLFMDEPFSALDAFTAEVLRSEVLKIWANKEIKLSSILLVSHDIQEVAYMADRIIVLGGHPATIRAVIENKLLRPRDYRSPEFLKLVEQLHDTYGQAELPSTKPTPEPEKIGPLPHATADQILGLARYLESHKGSQDIFKIGAESAQHFDKVLVILEAAELLNFIESAYRTASLTLKGKQFAEAEEKMRHKLWRAELLTIPLFVKICDLLQQTPEGALSHDELLLFLQQEMPRQDANAQLSLLIRWSHYGKLFTYHRKAKTLSLDHKEN